MFEGFELQQLDAGEASIRLRVGGSGPPLLLLHGSPQTHVMWHTVAPRLAEHFTVVAADLRGYGGSSKPPSTPDHEPHSKRAMARDQIEVMRQLGSESFAVAGHDRGGRCAYRMALDHPDRVERLAVLDILPTLEHYRRAEHRRSRPGADGPTEAGLTVRRTVRTRARPRRRRATPVAPSGRRRRCGATPRRPPHRPASRCARRAASPPPPR